MPDDRPPPDELEQREVEERSAPKARIVHAAVEQQGKDELDRPFASLFWAGIAAGVAIMASLWAQAGLHHQLPTTAWREAVAAIGYPLGFLIVILGRMQLFTEQTMVAVLPFAKSPSVRAFGQVMRLWAAVFVGNMIGVAAISAISVYGHLQSQELMNGMLEISRKVMERSPAEILLQGIPAGFIIASIAWIRSAADDGSFWIVLSLTYAIALCGFTHVIAGAVEAFLLLWSGEAGIGWLLGTFLIPALIGNIIGGTGLFALLAHAQVKEEI